MPPFVLSREQVREIDRRAVEEFGLTGLVLMENAGRGCVDTLQHLGVGGPVVICCGRGNNAGDGFVIARHLDLRGFAVKVLLFDDPQRLTGDAAANHAILSKADIPLSLLGADFSLEQLPLEFEHADWIVDALLGTGLKGAPRAPYDCVIEQINAAGAKRLAIDLPSGFDCSAGRPSPITVRADHTCTFVAAKPGMTQPPARPYVGQLHVHDIGAPRKLIESYCS